MAGQEFKQCPDCAERVRGAARICRFCGYSFSTGHSGIASRTLDAGQTPNGEPPLEADSAPEPDTAPAAPIVRARAAAGADFVPEWNDPIPSDDRPLVLEPLPPLPPEPRSGPFSFGFGTLIVIALVAVGFAAYFLTVFPKAAPVVSPSAAVSAPPPTADPAEVAARYQSFAEVASSGYTQAAGLYAQIAAGGASASTLTDLVSSLQTTSDTLGSIVPEPCFSTLYAQAVSLNQTALTDSEALAAATAGADTGAIISHLGGDLSSWQIFISSGLTGSRCGARLQPSPSNSSSPS